MCDPSVECVSVFVVCVCTEEGSNHESAAATKTNRRRKYARTCPGSEGRHTRTGERGIKASGSLSKRGSSN